MQDRERLKERTLKALVEHGLTNVTPEMVDEGIDLLRDPNTELRALTLIAQAGQLRQDDEAWRLFQDDPAVIKAYTLLAPISATWDREIVELAKAMMAVAFVWSRQPKREEPKDLVDRIRALGGMTPLSDIDLSQEPGW